MSSNPLRKAKLAGSELPSDDCPPPNNGPINVEISNWQQILVIDRNRLRKAIRHVLETEHQSEASLSIALVDDLTITRLHEKFLGQRSPTDVLTFPLHEPDEPLMAEIIVSVETAVRQAHEHDVRPDDEVILYVIHGILHLCGYDDQTPNDSKRMWDRQTELLVSIDLSV